MLSGFATAASQSGFGLGNLLILMLPLLLLVFLMTTQRRRVRAMQTFQDSLVLGEEVVTTSGIYGRVVNLDQASVVLEIAPGVQVRFDRRAVGSRREGTSAPPPGSDTEGQQDLPGSDPADGTPDAPGNR